MSFCMVMLLVMVHMVLTPKGHAESSSSSEVEHFQVYHLVFSSVKAGNSIPDSVQTESKY